jgi:NTE family protein
MKKKFALVLSGGGFKGAFQLGAIQYLKENWSLINPYNPEMKFDLIAGVSVGSLNGALIASGKLDRLEKLWMDVARNGVEEIYTSDFIDTKSNSDQVQFKLNFKLLKERLMPGLTTDNISLWKKLGLLFSKSKREELSKDLISLAEQELKINLPKFKAIADNTPLKNKLTDYLRKEEIKDCIFRCGYVSLDTGNYYSVRHNEFVSNEDFVNGVLASTSMPIVWEPVKEIYTLSHQAKSCVDGGIKNVSPLGDIIEEINLDESDAEYTIIIINCSNGKVEYDDQSDSNIAQIALRSLNDIAITEIFNNDLEQFIRINDILDQVRIMNPGFSLFHYDFENGIRTKKVLKRFKSIIIQPATGILGNTLVANKNIIERRIAHGRQKAEESLKN